MALELVRMEHAIKFIFTALSHGSCTSMDKPVDKLNFKRYIINKPSKEVTMLCQTI